MGIHKTVAREYCIRYGKDFPSRALARILAADVPELFSTVEKARSAVRKVRGAHGEAHRGPAESDPEVFTGPRERMDEYWGGMPDPIKALDDLEPLQLDASKALVIADLHIPYHDKQAVAQTMEYAERENVDAIIINGDLIDFYAASYWENDPRERDLPRELSMTREILGMMRERFGDIPIIFKLGNHEERWERYLKSHAPIMLGVDDFEIEKLLRCDDHDVQVLDRMRHIRIGHLNVVHGHEFGRTMWSPVNAARGLYLRAKATAICGHFHQSSQHNEKDMNGSVVSCWSTGCLCQLRMEYTPYNKWNHGFALVDSTDGVDRFRVSNHSIINGHIV